ncbi:hypothetical protein CLNEO_27910 [Anaerotignum neopropionicum]|uniref:YycH protein n=1 Tax=Anaerotignum neopropionicum TaxID=36847 RepID=A0A136WBW3_9FIRM|nr:hypothetical protein [Anaerotignum neopropionicum]KXL51819.1 hypothetical protein CLNEO_27910 [Anaerotignum neopropionicum]
MKLYKITNFVIVALVIAAVYQTGELWLEGTSSHNFFNLMVNGESLFGKQADGDVLLATRYAVGEGKGAFSVYYPDEIGTSSLLQEANGVLNEILSEKDNQVDFLTADWKEILGKRCMVMQYDFMVSADEYLSQYKRAKNSDKMDSFDYITILPSRRPGEESKAYFVNSKTNESVCYTTNKSQSASDFYDKLVTNDDEMTYISTGQKTGTSVIWRNLFLPQWAQLPYRYCSLREFAAFEKDGVLSRVDMENAVKGFFRNFSVDWSTKDESGDFIFSDSQTVIKYFSNTRVLDYYSYGAYGNDTNNTGLLEGYQICCNFLENDTSLTTDVFLADIEKKSNETIYYFDYAVNDLPVNLSVAMQEKIGSSHAIEVTVRNQRVKKYHRYVVNYEAVSTPDMELDVQFIDALDDANKTYQETVEEKVISDVRNISLGYYVDLTGNIDLKWFITLYDYLFVTDTYADPAAEMSHISQ